MAYDNWPATLPQYVLEQGFSENQPDQLLQTSMEAGRPKSRRRYSFNGSTFTVSIAMTKAQKVIFEDFFNDTLVGGSLPFTWVHPIHQTAANFQFRKPPPKWSVRGEAHIVSFGMERVP